jgi:hypothetical protein
MSSGHASPLLSGDLMAVCALVKALKRKKPIWAYDVAEAAEYRILMQTSTIPQHIAES